MKAFILTNPEYKGEGIEEVWLWKDFPYRSDFGTGHDVGIDLVAVTAAGEYWAVQCKCYDENAYISKSAVDTFITTSAKSFYDENGNVLNFSRRIWLDTSGKGFS